MSMIGDLQWAVSLGHLDLYAATLTLRRYHATPCIGHLKPSKCICYIWNCKIHQSSLELIKVIILLLPIKSLILDIISIHIRIRYLMIFPHQKESLFRWHYFMIPTFYLTMLLESLLLVSSISTTWLLLIGMLQE
jgi:hypothetical protein